jgi:hypothetical protein
MENKRYVKFEMHYILVNFKIVYNISQSIAYKMVHLLFLYENTIQM